MKNKKYLVIFSVVLVAVIILCSFYAKKSNKTDFQQNSVKFFEQMVSIDNLKLFLADSNDKIVENFNGYCTERGLSSLMENRIERFNFGYIMKHDIQSFKNLKVELIEQSSEGEETFMDYKITYMYIDSQSKEYELTDYYTLNYVGGKIDHEIGRASCRERV